MKNNPPSILKKARAYVFLLLKFRPRSENEIELRLQEKKFDRVVIKETIAYLKDKKLIDDAEFARAWIESRLLRPLSLSRVKQELEAKGIAKRVIEAEIKKASRSYNEAEVVAKLASRRLESLKNIDPDKAKRRVFNYLLRRGFSQRIIEEVMNSTTSF